ncbi:MAG TPA: class I SAM-dependent methyltransferase [Solirubrobacterales bacterium]|nr:class I SAM-dependent methyltransferase [Solirubrobacterales bacterium]
MTLRQPPAPEPSLSAGDPPRVTPRDAGLSEHARRNRAAWNADADDYQAQHGQQLAGDGRAWGTWGLPESELQVLGEVAGRDILELGCGAAQGSIDLARSGARPVGLDLSEGQLGHARRLVAQAGVKVPLVQASAEAVPLADASFDIVFCDHGAMNFADPYRTVPEVARLLRPGGLFAFCHLSPIADLCWPDDADRAGERLVRDYFGMHQIDAVDEVVFQLPYGEWIRLFRANGFAILDLIEPRPAPDAVSSYRNDEDRAWARRWPAECIWRLHRA